MEIGDKNKPSFDETEPVTSAPLFDETEAIDEPQKKNSESLSSSAAGSLESTESQSVSALPSISKIKQGNAKGIDLANSTVLKNKMAEAFSANPNPAYQKAFVETLAKKGYDRDQLNQYANALNPSPEKTPENYQSPTDGMSLSQVFGKNAVSDYIDRSDDMIQAGAKQTGRALGDIAEKLGGIPLTKEKPLTTTIKELGTDVLNVGAGTLKSAFGVGGLVVPQLAAFNGAVEAVKALPEEVKEKFILPTPGVSSEEKAKTFDKIIDLPFAAATTIAEELGYTPEEGSAGLATLEILNILIPLGAVKAKTGVDQRIKSIEDLQSISEKITEGKATEAEIKDYTDVSNGIKDVSIEEVKNAAEKKSEDLPIKDDELQTKAAELQAKIESPEIQSLPENDPIKQGLINDRQEILNQVIEKNKSEIDSHITEAANEAKATELQSRIDEAVASMEGQPESVKQSIQKTIDGLTSQKDELIKKEPIRDSAEQVIEANLREDLTENYELRKKEYLEKNGTVFDTDRAREFAPEYKEAPELLSTATQIPARDFVSKMYKEELAKPAPEGKANTVVFTAGGSGVGKSVLTNEIKGNNHITVDTNLSNFDRSVKDINEAISNNKKVKIEFVYRNPVDAFLNGVVSRAKDPSNRRTVPYDIATSINEKALKSIIKLSEHYKDNPNVEFRYFDNNYNKGEAKLITIEDVKQIKDDYIQAKKTIKDELDRQYKSGELTDQQYRGLTGESGSRLRESELGGSVIESVESSVNERKGAAEIISDLRTKIGAIRNEKDAGRRVEEIERTIKAIDNMLAKSASVEKSVIPTQKVAEASKVSNPVETSKEQPKIIPEEKSPEPKKLKLGERILASDEVSSEIKKGLEQKGIDYIPIKLDVTQADAKAYVKAFEEAGEIDRAISNVTNMSNSMTGVNRGAIGKELFETLAEKARVAETLSEQKKWQDKAVDIAKFTAENFKAAGQEINAAKAWKRMLEKTPEGAISSLKKDYTERNEPILKSHEKDISGAKEIIDEFIKSEDFEKLVGEKVKAEVEKAAKKSPKKENIFNSKAVRDTRKEELRKKWAEAKGSASASIVGLNKEQIEVLGEMGVIYLIDGAYNFKQWANKMKKEFNEVTEDQLQDIWSKVKVGKEYDSNQRTLSEFAKYGVFEKMTPEVKKQFLDKWDKRLQRLKPESRKKLLGNAIEEIQKLGGLGDSSFADMYAKELGLPTIDAVAEGRIRSLVETINKSEKSAKELQDLFDKGADKNEIAAKQKEWVDDIFKGQKANAELSEYFKNEKRLGTTLSTILQGNLLGTLSIAKNVYSNSLIQPLRFASRGIASGADYLMAKAAGLPLMNKLIKEGRTIDALAYWKGESKGVMPGLKTSFKELIQGINPEEMIERDLSQQLQPLKSIVKFYEGLTGKEKQTAYQQINNFTEGTFGFPAEVMFRLLNLGDKPFRKAAEFGSAYEIGKLKGLKGAELDKFVLFPDAKSAELIKEQSERAVYQQSEGLAKVAQQGIKNVEKYLSDIPYIGEVAQVVFKSQIPYVKTPLNILGETFQYALPEYTTAKAIYHSLKGERRSALENFGKAVTGFAIRAAVKSLVQNNLVTPGADYKDPEGTAIQMQNIPPNSLNITGLQRMMRGGNPSAKDNDVWINYNNMGVTGLLISIGANNKGLPENERGYINDRVRDVPYLAKSTLEQSFLQGTSAFLEAISGTESQKRKWAINTLGALGAITYPNTVSNISKASDDYIRVTKAPGFSDELVNTFKTKMFQGDELPTKVNLWGESVKSAPQGRNKYLWYLLDVTKFKDVPTDTYNYKIYDLWDKAEDPKDKRDILPNIPRNYLMVKKRRIDLDPKLYEQFQKITGKNRANLVEKYTKSPNWEKDDNDKKILKLTKLYKSGYDNAKKQLLFEHPELKKSK